MDKIEIIKIIQRRDADLIEKFCCKDFRLTDGGKFIRVSRIVPFDEILNVLHLHDEIQLKAFGGNN